MIQYKGKAVQEGIAIGKIKVLSCGELEVKRYKIDNPAGEISRINAAIEEAKKQLQSMYENALAKAGEETAAIFEVHQMMLEDEDYLE